jgi:hypothetical protein
MPLVPGLTSAAAGQADSTRHPRDALKGRQNRGDRNIYREIETERASVSRSGVHRVEWWLIEKRCACSRDLTSPSSVNISRVSLYIFIQLARQTPYAEGDNGRGAGLSFSKEQSGI